MKLNLENLGLALLVPFKVPPPHTHTQQSGKGYSSRLWAPTVRQDGAGSWGPWAPSQPWAAQPLWQI